LVEDDACTNAGLSNASSPELALNAMPQSVTRAGASSNQQR
jgi:hypothetical protein